MSRALEELILHEADFYPTDEVAEQLQKITFISFIGAVATGKTTSMDQVARLDLEFGVARSFATRPRRSNESDTNYRFLDRPEGLDHIAQMVVNRSGGLVQYGVHPTTGHVYGTEIRDYTRPYSMLAVLAKNVEALRKTPFGKMVELTLVTNPDEWRKRFERKNFSLSEASQRVIEGKQSLEWSLDQENMIWICTPSGSISQNAREIRDLIKGTPQPKLRNQYNRKVGEQLLRTISKLV